MRNHHNDPSKFETDNSMSIVVYDEKKDDWAKILYSDALNEAMKHCFDAQGNLMKDMPTPPQDYIFSCRDTNYKGDNSHQFTEWWGMLEQGGNDNCSHLPDHLPLECLRAHCASVEARLEAQMDSTVMAQVRTGLDELADWDENETPNKDTNAETNLQALLQKLLQFYPRINVSGKTTTIKELFTNIIFPRPVVYDTLGGQGAVSQMTPTTLNSYFGSNHGISLTGLSGVELQAMTYMLEKDGLTKSQVKNFKKEIGNKLKDAYEAAAKVVSAAGTTGAANPVGPLTRNKIRETQTSTKDYYIQWRTEGGSAGLVSVRDNADELLRAYPPIGAGIAATLTSMISAVTATAHLGSEFSVGSKRPASSANASWSKRAATDASSFMEGIGSKFSDTAAADLADLANKNWVMSSDHALFHAQNKVQNFARKVGSLSTPIQRIAAHCLYWSKVTSDSIAAWSVNNIVPPFSLCVARPYMTYDMCTCIMMKGGSETGATFQGHSDFQLGDDVQSKIHYGNYVSIFYRTKNPACRARAHPWSCTR